MDPYCPICEIEETAYNASWQCPAARDVWSAGCVKFQKSCLGGPNFLQVAEGMLNGCDQLEFSHFVGTARRIWLRRNESIHSGAFIHPNIIVQQTIQTVELFQSVKEGETQPESACPATCFWKNPPLGWFKANWDAGIDHAKGRVGLGAVIRDHYGRLWAAKAMTHGGFLEPKAVETLAASMASQLCIEMGFQQVQLEVRAMHGESWMP
jgi:hypothetical protein